MSEKRYAPGVREKMEEIELKEAGKTGTIFDDELASAGEEETGELQQTRDDSIFDELTRSTLSDHSQEISGIRVRPLTFASLALLRQINSVFVSYNVGISKKDQERVQALALKLHVVGCRYPLR